MPNDGIDNAVHTLEKLDKSIDKLVEMDDQIARLAELSPAVSRIIESDVIPASISTLDTVRDSLQIMPDPDGFASLRAMQRQFEIMAEPYRALKQAVLPAISQPLLTLAEVGRNCASLASSNLVSSVGNATLNLLTAFDSPIMHWFRDAISPPIVALLHEFHSLIPPDFKPERFNEIYLGAMYEEKWFPYIGWDADISLAATIVSIIEDMKPGAKRTKAIDQAVNKYYTKTVIEDMRKSWRSLGLPPHKVRILNQAVRAYHRKEYALTVSALVDLWEGIIAQKSHTPDDYRISRKTRDNLGKLIEGNNYDDILTSFCTEFIFYDCHEQEEVKDDVPGRHGIVHSWYDKYPSKKTALNAILFTDFLLKLEPLDPPATEHTPNPASTM